MAETIIDGQGKGYLAGVSSENRLLSDSKSRPSEEVEAQNSRAFILHGECHTAAAASGGLLYFTNTSSVNDVVVTRIYIDPCTITPTDLIITQVRTPATTANGTDISSTGIVQKNYGTANSTIGTLVISDSSSDMTYTGGSQYHAFPAKTMTSLTRDMKGTNVITPNTTILLGWKTASGSNATDGEIVSLSINCFTRAILS